MQMRKRNNRILIGILFGVILVSIFMSIDINEIATHSQGHKHKTHISETPSVPVDDSVSVSNNYSYFQPGHQCNGDQFAIDQDLIPCWNSFEEDAKAHGFDIKHIYCIKKIKLHNKNTGGFRHLQGLTIPDLGVIYLNKELLKDSIGLKRVFYHELGHWFGLKDSDNIDEIMAYRYDTDESADYTMVNWSKLVDDYFDKLKSVNNEN